MIHLDKVKPIHIGFTFLVLPFWCRLTRVVQDRIQESRKMVVCVCVMRLQMVFVFIDVQISTGLFLQ